MLSNLRNILLPKTFTDWVIRNIQLPKTFSEWVITCGFTVYLAAQLLLHFLPSIDPLRPAWTPWIVYEIGNLAFIVAVTVMIASGIGRIGQDGPLWRNASTLIIGIVIALALISIGFCGYYIVSTIPVPNDKSLYTSAEKLQQPDLNPEKRSQWSELYAQMVYLEKGKIVSYITPGGARVLYKPTSDDQDVRSKRVKGEEYLKLAKSTALRTGFTWLAVLVLSPVLGFIFRRGRKSKQG